MSNMVLSKEEFFILYPELWPYHRIFYKTFKTDQQFIEEYLPSKLWRLNNLYTIIDKSGNRIPFVMNRAQHKVYSALIEHPRLIILKSRQQGISTFWLMNFFDDAIFTPDLNIGLMAQGSDEATTLLERVKFSWDNLDPSVKEYLGIDNDKDNMKAFSFTNGSNIFIRTSFRSATLHRLHISELGKIANKYPQKAKETNTGTLQTIGKDGIVAIESTAEGDNMFKSKWDRAYEHTGQLAHKDLKAVFLSWIDDPDCQTDVPQQILPRHKKYFEELEELLSIQLTNKQKWFYIMQERELADSDEKDIQQEYPSTPEEAFAAAKDGAYYAKQFKKNILDKGRVRPDLYDPAVVVDVVLDLGMNDTFVLGFWQYAQGMDRLVHEYTESGEGLEHYVNYCDDWLEKNHGSIGVFTVPHDIKVKELGTGQSRYKRLIELGVRRIQVLPKFRINDGIEAVRRMIPSLWIDASCEYIIGCMKNYSKEWDDIRQNWKDRPFHDEWSHGADMVRYRAMSKKRYRRANVDERAEKRKARLRASQMRRKVGRGIEI